MSCSSFLARRFFPMLLGLLVACGETTSKEDPELVMSVVSPADGSQHAAGDFIRFETAIVLPESERGDALLGHLVESTVVLWSSDVVGALSDTWSGCGATGESPEEDEPAADDEDGDADATSDLDCWLTRPESGADGRTVWPLVTTLPPGTHVVTARAVDLTSGEESAQRAAVVVEVVEQTPPDVHLVAPDDYSVLEVGESFLFQAWIEDESADPVHVELASGVHGVLQEDEVSAPGTWEVACHAGTSFPEGDPEESTCWLSPGVHVMVLSATDGEGATSHSFLTVEVLGAAGGGV